MSAPEDPNDLPRVLGVFPPEDRPAPGPLLLLVGGVHGNEGGGIHAIRRVFDALERLQPRLRGRVVGIVGNRQALAAGERYLDEDLNRLWTDAEVLRLEREGPRTREGGEQAEVLAVLRRFLATGPERAVLMDLHSTSAEGSPFAIMSDSLQNRRVARALGVPLLLGLEERVDGTLLSWFSEEGHVAFCLEGGQSGLDSTVDHHVAAIWVTLVSAGLVPAADVPELEEHRETLATTAWGLPEFCEVLYRFEVPEDAEFRMVPGYTNFHIVTQGVQLATLTRDGEVRDVRCPQDGLLIMPRYQGQGTDGFFLGREIPGWALSLSAWLRRLRLGWALWLLPGVRRDATRSRGLVVDGRIARWRTLEILHLFGYRRYGREGHRLFFLRRPDALS